MFASVLENEMKKSKKVKVYNKTRVTRKSYWWMPEGRDNIGRVIHVRGYLRLDEYKIH